MRILFIINHFPPFEVGGYEQLCGDVAFRLAERGHLVRVLTSDYGVSKGGFIDEPDIQRSLHLQPDFESRFGFSGQFFLTRRREETYNLACFRESVRDFHPDVIFIWNLQRLPRSIARAAEGIPNVSVAYWLAGYSPAEPDEFWLFWKGKYGHPLIKPIHDLLAQLAFRQMRTEGKPEHPQMQHVAVVSEYMRLKGIADGTLPPHVQVIYNGVELDLFHRPVRTNSDGVLVLLQAGRVSIDKGVHTSIEAVGRVVREDHNEKVHLNIAGVGPAQYFADLKQIVKRYHIENNVTFLGALPRAQLPDLMAKCHVLLLPTEYQEPFARVVLEGMASGLTVLSTLTGGTGEIVQSEVTGLTFKAGDGREMANQISRLQQDNDLRIRLATQGQQLVLERFSFERMVGNIERFLENATIDRGS